MCIKDRPFQSSSKRIAPSKAQVLKKLKCYSPRILWIWPITTVLLSLKYAAPLRYTNNESLPPRRSKYFMMPMGGTCGTVSDDAGQIWDQDIKRSNSKRESMPKRIKRHSLTQSFITVLTIPSHRVCSWSLRVPSQLRKGTNITQTSWTLEQTFRQIERKVRPWAWWGSGQTFLVIFRKLLW